jgi:hypothetical protein
MNLLKGINGLDLLIAVLLIKGFYLLIKDWHRKTNQIKTMKKRLGEQAVNELIEERI